MASTELLRFLVLGHSPEGAQGYPHPVTISIYPAGRRTRLNFSIGPHLVNAGGQVGIDQVVIAGEFNESYATEFDAVEARWLIPFLVRLAAGEHVTAAELEAAHLERYGARPEVELSRDYEN